MKLGEEIKDIKGKGKVRFVPSTDSNIGQGQCHPYRYQKRFSLES
jgi:hypothetical protein